MNHKNECLICNNSIREERQYGALELNDNKYVIFDAQEFAYFDEWMKDKVKSKKQPNYKEIVPDENMLVQLVYGVLVVSGEEKEEKLIEKMGEFKNYALISLEHERIYYSSYNDIEIFRGKEIYPGFIPCAMLLHTSLDLKKKLEYGFGHTLFLKYKEMDIFDNILNREFLLCVRDIEKEFNPKDEKNWKKYIRIENMLRTAKYLF